MMFPPNFLHNRISAHYIEINHIFAIEMMKRYQVARKEILNDRERQTPEVRLTKYITNPNYVYEALGQDDDKMKRLKDDGLFWALLLVWKLRTASRRFYRKLNLIISAYIESSGIESCSWSGQWPKPLN
jgi:hypothetical protein